MSFSSDNKEQKEQKKQPDQYHHVRVGEAKQSKAYWDMIGYRHVRIAKFELLGCAKILLFFNRIPALKNLSKENNFISKTFVRYFISTWLFSTHEQFVKFTPELIKQELKGMIENFKKNRGVDVVFNDDQINQLYKDLSDIRKRWKKDISSSRLTQRFMRELKSDEKLTQFSEKVQQGKWLELDYHDEEFLRRARACIRRGLITKDDYINLQFLHAAVQRFQSEIRMRYYSKDNEDKKNDFDFLYYFTHVPTEDKNKFYEKLESVPKNHRCAFEFDINHEQFLIYLLFSLKNLDYRTIAPYAQIFFESCYRYIAQLKIKHPNESFEDIEKAYNESACMLDRLIERNILDGLGGCVKLELVFLLEKYISKYENPEIVNETNKLLNEEDAAIGVNLSRLSKLVQSTRGILQGIAARQPTAFFSLNEDKGSDKPILKIIVPSVGLLPHLVKTAYPESTYVEPSGILGSISPRKMGQISKSGFYRGVTLFDPDIQVDRTPHVDYFDSFVYLYHDILFHCIRESANLRRPLTQYLQQLIQNTKNIQMDTFIWSLIDGDFSTYELLQSKAKIQELTKTMKELKDINAQMKVEEKLSYEKIQYRSLYNAYLRDIFSGSETGPRDPLMGDELIVRSDIHLVITFDILKNVELWESLIKDNLFTLHVEGWLTSYINRKNVDTCRNILQLYPQETPMFHILAYRMNEPGSVKLNEGRWKFLKCAVDDKIPINNYLQWKRDRLYLRDPDDASGNTLICLKEMKQVELFSKIAKITADSYTNAIEQSMTQEEKDRFLKKIALSVLTLPKPGVWAEPLSQYSKVVLELLANRLTELSLAPEDVQRIQPVLKRLQAEGDKEEKQPQPNTVSKGQEKTGDNKQVDTKSFRM